MSTPRAKHPIQAGDGDPRHGTPCGYRYHGCRCEGCCEANRIPSSGVAAIVRPYLIRRNSKDANHSPHAIKPVMVKYLIDQGGSA